MGIEPAQYEALERDFREVLQSMVGERSMQRFQAEYEKLYRALKTSYESEKRLVKRCKELNETIVSNATRVKAAMRLTQEDSSTISLLRKEVDRAWKLVETAKEKEEAARRIIQDLKTEVGCLNKIVEEGTGLSWSQDNNVQMLHAEKKELKSQLDSKLEAFAALEATKNDLHEQVDRLHVESLQKDKELKLKTQEVEELKVEKSQLQRTKDDEISKAKNIEDKKNEI
jgi:chromosome segregation ATPase